MHEGSTATRHYFIVFALLIALTFATVALSFINLGTWHLALGMGIGAIKAALVGLFFMHLNRSNGRTWIAAGFGVIWLGIMLTLTMTDYLTRPLATL